MNRGDMNRGYIENKIEWLKSVGIKFPPDEAEPVPDRADALEADYKAKCSELELAHTVVDELREQLAALQKDAERYHWLRDTGDEVWEPLASRSGVTSAHQIDEAIDMSIAAEKEMK